MLETGPDEQMGAFGRLAPDGSSDYVPVMRFEPTATSTVVKELPARLTEPVPVNSAAAVRRRQLVLNSGLCATGPEAGRHAEMASLTGINGKPFDIGRIDIETKLGTTEIWQITSIGMAHPFHVHGALFRVLSIEGEPPPA
jgi:blue copper oxidase